MFMYLIDPIKEEVSKLDLSELDGILLTHLQDILDTREVRAVNLEGQDNLMVLVDGEAELLNKMDIGLFQIDGYPAVLRGRGLVCSVNSNYDFASPEKPILDVSMMVDFPNTVVVVGPQP